LALSTSSAGQALAAIPEHPIVVNTIGSPRRAIPADATEQVWRAPDGCAIRRIDWTGSRGGARGSVLFLPGRADFYEKYTETLAFWAAQGWRVTALDWRWQAGSGRFHRHHAIGGVDDFSTWINDLASFWGEWSAAGQGPSVLIGHSMGGHLALRAVAEAQVRPDALVLSAPMLGFVTPVPERLQAGVGWLMCRIGDPARAAWGEGERPGDRAATRGLALTHDADRYADELWWRARRTELDMGPASWHWVRKAGKSIRHLVRKGALESVDVPTLVLAATHDALVSWPAISRAAARLPQVELVAFGPEAAHELLREADPVRDAVLAAIDRFLARHVPDLRA
jgi:lysophospholipase